jgi:hypothetical protein
MLVAVHGRIVGCQIAGPNTRLEQLQDARCEHDFHLFARTLVLSVGRLAFVA